RPVMGRYVSWIDLAVSRLRRDSLDVEAASLCQFSQEIGIGQCSDRLQLATAFATRGSTNLHDAIAEAAHNDLAFILTDGVAAAGAAASGDCASSVDAACVARALKDALHPTDETRGDSDRGIWIIPLVAPYDGVFYTERKIAVTEFNQEQTDERIHADVRSDVAIQNPKVDKAGNLNFVYRGPRAMLLIVIARWTDLGRAAMAALADVRGQADVDAIDALNGYRNGTAALTPIEVYPGIARPVSWAKSETDEDAGSIDAALTGNTIGLQCVENGVNETTQTIDVEQQQESGRGECAAIWTLPGFNFRLHAARPDNDVMLASFITRYAPGNPLAAKSQLKLRLRCGPDQGRPCNSNPVRVNYTASANYGETSKTLSAATPSGPFKTIADISTLHPDVEPHRIFAFTNTLKIFYDQMAAEQYRVSIGELALCNETKR
ncbi:MAG TPA: hypothetical protein VFN10_02115, partial [Thermoanaerobaculia bacterium]|nr:hypothetical protein [Thermoanaerobaculia bacterium]